MKFRTEYNPVRSALTLDPTIPIVLVGSCFAANIAAKMQECMWNAFNGLGTLYNPMSIAKVLQLSIFEDSDISDIESSLFDANGKFNSWLFDSHFSASTRNKCIQSIKEARIKLLAILDEAQALIITFGTAWCYSLSGINEKDSVNEYIVANCHKMPSSLFHRRRVSIDEISSIWINLCNKLKLKYPNLTIIFTVSPVRHLKDGFEGNTLSKATLHLAVERICEKVRDCLYFPAYELVNDDLRDYRFYATDLVHPSEAAVEYIWEVFCNTFLDELGTTKLKDGNRMFKRLNHRQIIQK